MEIIRSLKINRLLTKLTRTHIGALDDEESIISLIKFNDKKYNISLKHKGIKLGNPEGIYLFPEPVDEKIAREEYDKFLLI